ncbi:MAG: GatB/YqeY domain-containing protein [Acidimicrobiia bacterium]
MTIQERLAVDQTTAMKSKDKPTLNAIRSVQAEVSMAKSAAGFSGSVNDDLYIATITTYVKRMDKARAEYEAMGDAGAQQASELAFEIDYLTRFLPVKLDETATRMLVERTIADLGATSGTPIGQIIGTVMKSGEDVDGALVNRIVREALESQ